MPRKEYIPPEPKFWRYDIGDGWTILAGKTDEDNDLLSLRFARPEEHWFHVRSMSGSHVILRGPEGEEPTREMLEMAASVAAWHSKARGGGRCAVTSTLAKHVSKPRGSKPGLVEITHETVLKVHPALPGNKLNARSKDSP